MKKELELYNECATPSLLLFFSLEKRNQKRHQTSMAPLLSSSRQGRATSRHKTRPTRLTHSTQRGGPGGGTDGIEGGLVVGVFGVREESMGGGPRGVGALDSMGGGVALDSIGGGAALDSIGGGAALDSMGGGPPCVMPR